MAKEQAIKSVALWLDSCLTRFKNMHQADLDLAGYPAIQKAMANFDNRGLFSVGEIQYLFHRSHKFGKLPKYNTHKGYNKLYGEILPCPIQDLIDSGLVNWPSGQNGVIEPELVNAIQKETKWTWTNGNLRPQKNTSFNDLFC